MRLRISGSASCAADRGQTLQIQPVQKLLMDPALDLLVLAVADVASVYRGSKSWVISIG